MNVTIPIYLELHDQPYKAIRGHPDRTYRSWQRHTAMFNCKLRRSVARNAMGPT